MPSVSGDSGSSAPLRPDQVWGVWGQSDEGFGVVGTSARSSGVQGGSIDGVGTVGTSENLNGVTAISTNGTGLYARGGRNAAVLDGDVVINGTAAVHVLDIVGTGDVAETFLVSETIAPDPGTVMVIADGAVGAVAVSRRAYDRRVAGVISGGAALGSGVILRAVDSPTNVRLALVGTVYCKAEAVSAPISAEDLLTTSDIDGHAMAVRDQAKAGGAILGKALAALGSGTGLVLMLVNLQ